MRSRLRTGIAQALVFALLLLIGTSERQHNHPGAEAGMGALCSPPRGESVLRKADSIPWARGVPCLACFHNRTSSVKPTGMVQAGRPEVRIGGFCPVVPIAPLAPSARPASMRAPPLA